MDVGCWAAHPTIAETWCKLELGHEGLHQSEDVEWDGSLMQRLAGVLADADGEGRSARSYQAAAAAALRFLSG
ncbi:MAG: hypothetical protein JO222_09265 [Frankiales bacterium]|nr:hypothetical protein [Frankiales bacterium]